jgi:predicted nucleic acid-binding protein
MTRRFGIDTSVLVRLVTGEPAALYDACLAALRREVGAGATLHVSTQVVGEAYVAIQHHYGIDKAHVRRGLAQVLTSGLVHPECGDEMIRELAADGGAGLVDRLIALEYRLRDCVTLTLDRRMAGLPNCRGLLSR